MNWLPEPWDAIALILLAAVAGYVLERLFLWLLLSMWGPR